MIDTIRMRINSLPIIKIKSYSDFVVKEKPRKKAAVIKRAALAASADQRKLVNKAKRKSR